MFDFLFAFGVATNQDDIKKFWQYCIRHLRDLRGKFGMNANKIKSKICH